MFDKFDHDKSGSIDDNEFQLLIRNLGYAVTAVEVKSLLKVLDSDGSGHVEKKEFATWWRRKDRWDMLQIEEHEKAAREDAATVFKQYSGEFQNKISRPNFSAFCKDLVSKGLTNKSEAKILEDLDSDQNGSVSYSEYLDWLVRTGPIKQRVAFDNGVGAELAAAARAKNAAAEDDYADGPPLKEDPKYGKFFKMLKIGVPMAQVRGKVEQEGLDGKMIECDPEKPRPLTAEEKAVRAAKRAAEAAETQDKEEAKKRAEAQKAAEQAQKEAEAQAEAEAEAAAARPAE
jgi:Ca2+-binding EF-hand superfamily protein